MADKEHRHSYGEDGICHCGESFDTEIDALKAELDAEKLVAQKAVEYGARCEKELEETQKALLALAAGYQRDQLPDALWLVVHVAQDAINAKGGSGNRTPNAEDFYQGGNSR